MSLILITSLFTVFNAILLLFGYGRFTKGNTYLTIVFFVLGALGMASPEVLKLLKPELGIFIFPTLLPLNFLIGPFIYFYFRFLIKNILFQFSRDFMHLVLFIIFFINLLPFYLYSISDKIKLYELYLVDILSPFKIKLLFMDLSYYYLLGEVQMLFYLVLCFVYLLYNKARLVSKLQLDSYHTLTTWLIYLHVILSILFFMNVIIGVRSFYLGTNPESYYFYAVSFFLFFLNIKLYQYPTLMYGIKFKTSEEQKKYNLINRKQKEVKFEAQFSDRFSLFLTELRESKHFLDSNFSIQSIADSLQTSTHKVKKYLEIELNSNFSQLKNQLRIMHFLDSVKPSDFEKYNLSGLIKSYGFTNTSQFRALFDKYAPESFDSFLAKIKNNG